MIRKKYDLFFIFSIIFITLFGLFLLNDFIKNKDLDTYLQVVKEKIAEMIPEEERDEFEKMYSGFIRNVDDDKLKPSQLKELAEKIVILRQEKEILSPEDIKRILPKPDANEIVQALPTMPEVSRVKEVEWVVITKEFEKSLKKGDSIRVLSLKHLNLKKELELKLEDYSKMNLELKKNHKEIAREIEGIKNEILHKELTKGLKKEIQTIIADNEQLNQNLIALEKIEMTIKKEKEKLLEELKKIESN